MATHKDEKTESRIKLAAQKAFHKKGFDGARMQDIADSAGINKALLHYYFRSKDQLFHTIFQEALGKFFPIIIGVLESDMDVEAKIEKLVHTYIDHLTQNPMLASFIIHELNQNPERLKAFLIGKKVPKPEKFLQQIAIGVEQKQFMPIAPGQLLVSIVAQCIFPFMARPMVQFMLSLSDKDFDLFIEQRKKEITDLIIHGLTVRKS